jgi:Protein of unknown function (DUF998)
MAARLAVAGATLFLLALAALHLLEPEIDPAWRMISDYELGRFGGVMVLAFVSLALSTASLAVALRAYLHTVVGYVGLGCLLACAVGLLGGGVFTTDPLTATSEQLTMHGTLHGLSALVGMASMPFAASLIGWGLARNRAWATARRWLLGAPRLIWLSLIVFGLSIVVLLPRGGGTFGPGVVVGWQNRLVMLAYCGWLITVGWHTARG